MLRDNVENLFWPKTFKVWVGVLCFLLGITFLCMSYFGWFSINNDARYAFVWGDFKISTGLILLTAGFFFTMIAKFDKMKVGNAAFRIQAGTTQPIPDEQQRKEDWEKMLPPENKHAGEKPKSIA